MTKRTFLTVFCLLLAPLLLEGCAPAMGALVRDKCRQNGCTREQQYVAEAHAYRVKFTTENSDGTYSINYAVLPNKMLVDIVKRRLEDLDEILDYKNSDWTRHIEEFGLRPELEHQEKVFKALYDRLLLVDNYDNFKEYMGERSSNSYHGNERGYDGSRVFVEDVFKAYPFNSDRIDQARLGGTLKEVERFVWSARRELGHKDPDPSDPEDPNKFIWRLEEVGVEFVSYKVIDSPKPKDNSIDYVEGTRLTMTQDGLKRESKPALKMFVSSNGMSVIVIDQDREDELGFNLPDFVDNTSRITSAQGLVSDSFLTRLFSVKESDKRIKPKDPPPIVVEIAPVGKNRIDVWEYKDTGWAVPFKYKNNRSDNYWVGLKIKNEDKPGFDPISPVKQIEYLKKMWNGTGSVVEYFYPKDQFGQANVLNAYVNDRRVQVVTGDGREVTGYVTPDSNTVIQDKPYSVEYTESDMRWLLMDEDGDGKFEKRREISK